jgi:hypothetical protein
VRPYAVPGNSLLHLPGPVGGSGRDSDGLEGYARTFLLAAFRAARAEERHAERLLAPYAEGLAAGTGPRDRHAWPSPAVTPQAKVEAASVAIGLHESRRLVWDRLPEEVRQRTADWLGGLAGTAVPRNNWVWFKAVVAAFLRSVGAPYAAGDIAEAIERTETWYAGDGWYSDGARVPGQLRNFDHYNGWAMHLFPLWYCRISGDAAEPGLTDRYRARLRSFLHDAVHLVAANGAPLFQGRSLTYRFATAAPFFVGALFDATPLAPGLTRRAGGGILRHFLDRGATRENGLLSLGWHHRFEPIRQHYSGPASPYWASLAFTGLLLPPGHPVWTEPEEPLPVERADFTRAIAAPGWLVTGTAADGIIRVANHGTDHTPADRPARDDPFYARHAYSTHTAPDLGPPLDLSADPEAHPRDGNARGAEGPDNRVALVGADGELSHRSPLSRVALDGRTALSRHVPHWPVTGEPERERWPAGPSLLTASVCNGPWEVRLVRVAGAGQRVSIGGHALAAAGRLHCRTGDDHVLVHRSDGLASAVFLMQLPEGDPELSEYRATGANPLGDHSSTPVYRAAGPAHAVAVFLGEISGGAPLPVPRAELTPVAATVWWPDGSRDTFAWPAGPEAGRR